MPWWQYRMANEGLQWEQPWLPRVEMVEVKDRGPTEPMDDAHEGDLAELGFTVRQG